MSKPAAIAGTFADLKTVKTRGVLQMVIEVPIEQGAHVVEAFGFPQPGAEIPVAVARLVAGHQTIEHEPEPQSEAKQINSSAVATEKPYATRAVMLAKDEAFQRFALGFASPDAAETAEEVATRFIREHCRVFSRSQLNDPANTRARRLYDALYRDFLHYQRTGIAALGELSP
jgi:hypothetical protein